LHWARTMLLPERLAPAPNSFPVTGLRLASALALILVLCLAPGARAEAPPPPPPRRQMAYDPAQPIPANYHVEHRTRYGLIVTGSLLFAISYGPTLAAAFLDGDDGAPLFAIPILGPLLAIPGQTRNDCVEGDHNPCFDFTGEIAAILIADTLVQAVGLLVFWKGYQGRDLLIRDQPPEVALAPGRVGASGYGAWLSGRF
jgi:hypothetical protein